MSDTLESLELEVKHKASGADAEIKAVTSAINSLMKAVTKALPGLRELAEALDKIKSPITFNDQRGSTFNKSIQNVKASTSSSKSASEEATGPLSDALQEQIKNADKLELALHKATKAANNMNEAFQKGDENAAWREREREVNAVVAAENELAKASRAAAKAQKANTKSTMTLSQAVKKSLEPMSSFVASLKRIAMYRLMRTIIKAITQSMMEGLKYAYLFSKGITTEGHRFSAAMDQMKSATTKMKAQLGSAFISLLTALMPIFLRLINLVLKLADAMSQLFAALTGTTYLKAKDVSVEFEDAMQGGAKAAKEWKNQLLGFDEINKLEAPGDSGGGTTGLDPSQMFEDAPIEEWAMKIRNVVEWLEEHLSLVKGLAIAIGAALLAWKVANIIGNLMGIEGGLGGIFAGIALVIGGFVLLASGMLDWIRTGELTEDAFWKIEIGIVAIGIGISLLTGSWIPLLVAVVLAAIFAIITQWDKLKAKLEEWHEKLSSYLGNGKLEWQDFAAVFVNSALGIIKVIETIISWIQTLIGWIRSAFDWINSFNSRFSSGPNYAAAVNESVYLTGFASGGYPDEGQVFVARERGPEMVGTVGGRTAVANNADIVSAIEGGVYRAISSAGGSGKSNQPIVLSVNGRELARVLYSDQQAVAREHGVRLINY